MLIEPAPGVTVIADVDVDGDAAPADWPVTGRLAGDEVPRR
jgi:hypothetical protein